MHPSVYLCHVSFCFFLRLRLHVFYVSLCGFMHFMYHYHALYVLMYLDVPYIFLCCMYWSCVSKFSQCIDMCQYVYLCNTCSICILSRSYHAVHHFQSVLRKIITHVPVPISWFSWWLCQGDFKLRNACLKDVSWSTRTSELICLSTFAPSRSSKWDSTPKTNLV